jgi:hypothetical protein
MPINNRGTFVLTDAIERQVNQDWPAANTDFDLFVQDLIASGNVIANGLIIRNIEVSDNILSGNITASGITANTLVLDILTANTGTFQDLTVNGNLIVGSGGAAANATISYDDNSDRITFNKSVDINGNLVVSGDLTIQGNTVTLNTATLTIEDKNIVLANGAVDAATADGAGITIDGAGANITYRESGDKLEINKTVDILGDLNVTGNISGNGLIIRGIEVSDAILSGNITVEGGITGNTIAVDAITANIWNNLYTANVIETAGNLYFTVQRARDSFTAGDNITIVDGEISAESQFLTVVNDSTIITSLASNLTYNMGRSVNDSRNILVIVEGLIQIPEIDYTVDASDINFIDQPPPGANIEIRFFGAEGSSGSRSTLISSVNSFVGTGNVDYVLGQIPPNKNYITIIIDGVTQQNDAYNLNGTVLTFTEAPAVGANIDVRVITGQVGAPFNTRTFVGDGSNTIFTISNNFNQDQILVFENGVAQVPGADYIVSAGNVIFNTAPAANVGIQIRELASSGANLLVAIAGLDQTTGSLVPDVDGIRSLGSSTKRFKDLYLTGNTLILGSVALSSIDGLLQLSPVIDGNIITSNAAPSSFTAGDGILIEANGRLSTSFFRNNTVFLGNISVSSSDESILLPQTAVIGNITIDGSSETVTGNITFNTISVDEITSGSIRETKANITSNIIDLSVATYFTKTINSDITFLLENNSANERVSSFIFELQNGGANTINWFSGITWPAGEAPVLTESGIDVLGFFSYNGGITWRGFLIGKDMQA